MGKKALIKAKAKNKIQIEKMKVACVATAKLLDYLTDFVKVGVSTLELNDLAHEWMTSRGYKPATLNYHGFPKSICISINEVVCHGIPSEKDILKNGDIVNIDVTVIVDGWFGDHSRMFYVGNVSAEDKELIDVAYNSMMVGIEQVKSGAYISDIGKAIFDYASSLGYGVVKNYCGHGIGTAFHEQPQVLNFDPQDPNQECRLRTGMTFTVEPMINAGTADNITLSDDWTVVTNDGKKSAQFEHTIVVTEDGYEILTVSPKNYIKPPYKNKSK
ncbi:MAG: type I methionyl aminopeptidase [Proteobacteria bacterium]|nr:type I methionyl aminopeptidase [Pseudomonadota bacterium]